MYMRIDTLHLQRCSVSTEECASVCSETGFETAEAPPPPVSDHSKLLRAKVVRETVSAEKPHTPAYVSAVS